MDACSALLAFVRFMEASARDRSGGASTGADQVGRTTWVRDEARPKVAPCGGTSTYQNFTISSGGGSGPLCVLRASISALTTSSRSAGRPRRTPAVAPAANWTDLDLGLAASGAYPPTPFGNAGGVLRRLVNTSALPGTSWFVWAE